MREILFRGKRVEDGEWVEGFLLKECRYESCSWPLAIEYYTGYFGVNEYAVAEVIPETVGQYTGLMDRRGKKIFEGDILTGTSIFGGHYFCGYVEYGSFNCSCCDGVYGWYLTDGDIRSLQDPTALTVVGNKWDNPELLEVDDG